MKGRKIFLIIAGILPIFFGLNMMFNPKVMLDMVAIPTDASMRMVLQWMACPLATLGVINFLSARDEGSTALRAVLLGNVVVHILGMGVDIYQRAIGQLNLQGVVFGAVIHLGLGGGAAYFLMRLSKRA